MKNLLVTVGIIAALLVGLIVGVFITPQVTYNVGASAVANPEFLEVGALVTGNTGVETLSAAATTTTLTSKQLCSGKTILWTPSTNNATATLPTTIALIRDCLPRVGMSLNIQVRSGAATTTFNVVAGTGQTIYHVMESATSTAQGTTITSSTPTMYRFTITNVSGTDSTASLFQTKYLAP